MNFRYYCQFLWVISRNLLFLIKKNFWAFRLRDAPSCVNFYVRDDFEILSFALHAENDEIKLLCGVNVRTMPKIIIFYCSLPKKHEKMFFCIFLPRKKMKQSRKKFGKKSCKIFTFKSLIGTTRYLYISTINIQTQYTWLRCRIAICFK